MEEARQHPALGRGGITLAAVFAVMLALAASPGVPALAGEVAAEGESVTLASGLEARLLDLRLDEGDADGDAGEGVTLRMRFVSDGLAPGEDRTDDMQALCEGQALPRVAVMDPAPSHVVITLADREIPFGEAAPDAVQTFESYRIKGGACVWELF